MGSDAGPGIPGWFVALVVLFALVGIGSVAWRISLSRKLARSAGLDPNEAAAATMLSNGGVGAVYLASTLAAHASSQPQPSAEPASTTEERLKELQALKDKGMISDAEYDAQRQKILGSI